MFLQPACVLTCSWAVGVAFTRVCSNGQCAGFVSAWGGFPPPVSSLSLDSPLKLLSSGSAMFLQLSELCACASKRSAFAVLKPECFDLQVCRNYLGPRILWWWKWLPSKETASAGQSLTGFAGVFYAGCSPHHRGDLSYPINWRMRPARAISQ